MENIGMHNQNEAIPRIPNSYLNSFKKRIYSTILQAEGVNPEDWLCSFLETMGKIKSNIRINSIEHLKGLNIDNIKNKEDLARLIAEELFCFYNNNYTIGQIKEFSREDRKEFGFLEINEVLAYDFNEAKTEINIHTPIIPTDDIMEIVAVLIDGFKKLAQKIKLDKEFSSIKKVKGCSWIVYYHRKFIEKKLGFSIESIDEKSKKATASISREEFLEKYGKDY